jgi:hypothetical protein
MGAWGVGTFENDDACDYAAEIANSSNLSRIEASLDHVLKSGAAYLEAPEAFSTMARFAERRWVRYGNAMVGL